MVNAFHYWYLSAAPNHRTSDEGLTDTNGNIAVRAFAIGNWSKFVRPGWHEVGMTSRSSLLVTAFQNETGDESAVVLVSKRSSSVLTEFEIGSAMRGPITPWLTSGDHSLARQAPVNVAAGTFSYSVPGESIVTLSAKEIDLDGIVLLASVSGSISLLAC
jgi:O-glycosyl hydrolase